jgi:signal transduction histidine kinase
MRPAKGIAYLVGLTAVFWLISWGLFALFRYNLESAHPLLVIAFSYYFFIPYRLIKEARASWEYQQKNKLLMQVEELKTNFISMMSHDLKTPLARIQGMADIVLEDDSKLNDEQVKAAKTIRKSTEELSNLVTSILDLGRIESQNVKLNLHSKDVNQIVNDVCNRCSHYAADKDIQLVTELEPLFSIKIDEHLISQVISNLVENAIKYSPNGTKVMVSTDEMDNKVVIQVSDQGPGIPEEDIGNIFMKFYRSKAAKSSPIKGSGLGLYLAKYFVELHKGSLTVDSVPGQGTTFTVELPNHQ